MSLLNCLSRTWSHIQGNLFPWLTEELGPLTETHKQVVTALELGGVEAFVQVWPGLPGRPPCDRAALARAFVAKAVIGLPTTSMLMERLTVDKQLRRLCGWEHPGELPSEATFSRGFAEFARSELPSRLHEALIERTHGERLVGHISRDATAIEAREKPVKTAAPKPPKRKRGRPKKGEAVEKKQPRRLERQADMSLAEMLSDLPTHCAVGTKRNAKGHTTSWIGYKLHLDVADGDPVSPHTRSPTRRAVTTTRQFCKRLRGVKTVDQSWSSIGGVTAGFVFHLSPKASELAPDHFMAAVPRVTNHLLDQPYRHRRRRGVGVLEPSG